MEGLFGYDYYKIRAALVAFLNPQELGVLLFFRASAQHLMVIYECHWMPVFIEQLEQYLIAP
jgi:hypothetical protein